MVYALRHGASQYVMCMSSAVPNCKQLAGGPKKHRPTLYWHFTVRKYKNPINWNIRGYRENQILTPRDI